MNHAVQCTLRAELVALQIHLVERAPVHCLLGLDARQVDELVVHHLT